MAAMASQFEELKDFVNFTSDDAGRLKTLGPVFGKHGKDITDAFYQTLERFPVTAKIIEGRVDALKATHGRWMEQLFQGEYNEDYFQSRMRIGMAHVRINLPPYYVEGVMNFLRSKGLEAIMSEMDNEEAVSAHYSSLLKILDLDLMIINIAYAEERLDRISAFTGMRRNLIENIVKAGGKK